MTVALSACEHEATMTTVTILVYAGFANLHWENHIPTWTSLLKWNMCKVIHVEDGLGKKTQNHTFFRKNDGKNQDSYKQCKRTFFKHRWYQT